ncbi:Integrin beta-PS [Nymphon striatum]|nr:Integrin beta-PS [Nymphon striatum]
MDLQSVILKLLVISTSIITITAQGSHCHNAQHDWNRGLNRGDPIRSYEILRVLDSRTMQFENIMHRLYNFQVRSVDGVNEQLGSSIDKENIVQIKPQQVRLSLRPKVAYPLVLNVKQAKDYPVDLYYLMDLSNSMKDDKDKLAELGDLLAEHMGKITANFRLGFGSFVDKVVMPYTNTVPAKLREPCTDCAAPYGFKNHMSLSLNTSQFSRQVNEARVSGNLDAPEGGFDAIMQVMVCPDIGWRTQSRKLLVFSTDSSFHTAGDGKIGGIVKPNDEGCHLDTRGFYSASSHQDYPSISQIDRKSQEKQMNIIFAVTAGQVPTYERVKEQVVGSTAGTLTSDSSNVVELIKDQYNVQDTLSIVQWGIGGTNPMVKITSVVDIRDNAPGYVQVKYFSKCLGEFKEATSKCYGLKVGDQVEFEAEITVLECPADPNDWETAFYIYPVGLEPLFVKLKVLCECECSKPRNEVRGSSTCSNGNGTYTCGICECNKNRFGRYCECDRTNPENRKENKNCYKKGDTTPCSGKGQCICGNCECNSPDITGNQCECDNFDCPRHNGLLCSGPENGDCECGKCVCRNSRTGPTCECGPDWQCVNPDTKEVCSGNGVCSCGACTCYETEAGMYTGAYCQYSPELRKTCDDFKSCVLCDVHKTGDFADYEFCKNCTDRMTIVTEEIVEVQEEGEQLCFITDEYEDEDGCKIRFVYSFNGTMPIIRAEEEKHCLAGDRDALIWGIIAALLVLLIGLLLLLLWKLWTRYKDRRDYAKFEKERESAKWDTYGLNRKELGTRYISYREVSSGKDRNRSDNPKPSYLENMVHQRQ